MRKSDGFFQTYEETKSETPGATSIGKVMVASGGFAVVGEGDDSVLNESTVSSELDPSCAGASANASFPTGK